MNYREYAPLVREEERISEEEFDKIIEFATYCLFCLCQKLIPYWKHRDFFKNDFLNNKEENEEMFYILILLIHHIHKSGGADYYNNVDNFITEAKTGAFSYKIKKDFLDYDNLPTNPMILTMLKNYLRRKGLLQCGI